jgi:DNA-binding FadR family transcriptional regulator
VQIPITTAPAPQLARQTHPINSPPLNTKKKSKKNCPNSKNLSTFDLSDDLTTKISQTMARIIERTSLSEVVAQHLQSQIQSGAYQLEQQLPSEHELTREFGVGRSSIREAIRKLENNGMVRVQQGLGTFVIALSPARESLSKLLHTSEDRDIAEVREVLEIKIVEKAARFRTEDDIRNIKANLEKRNKAADQNKLQAWLEADMAFHLSIAAASKNPVLANIYKTFVEQQLKKSIKKNYSEKESMHRLTELHIQLLDTIIKKQPAKAIELVKAMRNG